MVSRNRRFLTIAGIVVILTVIPTIAAFAATSLFDDVPDDSIFVSDINWMKEAGVTKGCNPPLNTKYCPDANVKREQMAAFMHRLASNRVVDAGTVEGLTAAELKGKDGESCSVVEEPTGTFTMTCPGSSPVSWSSAAPGPVVMTASGNSWLPHGQFFLDRVEPFERWATETTFFVPVRAVISLTGPGSIDGVEYGLESFDLCVITSSNYVSEVSVTGIASFGSDVDDDQYLGLFHEVFGPSHPNPGLTTGCHTFSVNAPVGHGAGLYVEVTDISDGSPVTLSSVRSVWTPEAAQS
jgi:hypothetical protein